MKTLARIVLPLASLLCCATASAGELKPQVIEDAKLETIGKEPPPKPAPHPDPAIVRLQVLLDRAGSSPGVIDGFDGDNVRKAVAGFESMHDLPVDGALDPEVIGRLKDGKPVMRTVEIRQEDVDLLVESIPEDFEEQAKLGHLGYVSIPEMLSERFHMDIDLVRAFNPGATFEAGETVSVVEPGQPIAERAVRRIEADKRNGQVRAYAEDGTLIAVYPATIGSEETPSPTGTHKVKGVARTPTYTYDPERNFQQGDNTEKLILPEGPNNPVGTVWIDLTEPTYGIHGTPEPSLIDKVGSHGCIRLANWDAEELSELVKPGVTVEFVE